jgi:hypothetical protein
LVVVSPHGSFPTDSMSAIRDRVNKIQTTIADRMGTGDNDMDVELIFTQFRKAAEGTAW